MPADERQGALGAGRADLAALADLGALEVHIGECHRCPLGDTRTRLVFGVGDPHARLMFIGEAPGKNEDLKGEPFVGAAGKLLDELLASIGLVRSQVYIANVLKCRPPRNRNPLPEEIETCVPFLAEQVRLIAPSVIATLGNFATRAVLGTERGITHLRGRLFHVDGRRVVPIYHPAAALYDQTKRDVLFGDFQRLKRVLEMPEEPAPTLTDSPAAPDAPGEQPTLF
jgi:DNA polymerase